MFSNNSSLMEHDLQQKRLVFEFSIVANATPADKKVSSDVPGCVYVRTEGLTAEADAVEDLTGQVTAPNDANGIFAVLIALPVEKEKVQKIYKSTLTEKTATGSVNALTNIVTTENNIAINIDSDQSLATTDLTFVLEVEYLTVD